MTLTPDYDTKLYIKILHTHTHKIYKITSCRFLRMCGRGSGERQKGTRGEKERETMNQ